MSDCTCKPDEGVEYLCPTCTAKINPLPPFADTETPITVQELRELAYSHGKHVAVLVTWNSDTGAWQIVTSGSNAADADIAVCIRQQIEKLLQLTGGQTIEDRRHEHRK